MPKRTLPVLAEVEHLSYHEAKPRTRVFRNAADYFTWLEQNCAGCKHERWPEAPVCALRMATAPKHWGDFRVSTELLALYGVEPTKEGLPTDCQCKEER